MSVDSGSININHVWEKILELNNNILEITGKVKSMEGQQNHQQSEINQIENNINNNINNNQNFSKENISIKTFSNKNKKDCNIETIFKLFEANNKHQGNIKDVGRRLINHFNGDALATFMNRFDSFNDYNEMKDYMIKCFDHHSLYSAEEELDHLKDTDFKRFTDFLLKFARLKYKSQMSEKRAIELLIKATSNKNIQKQIFMKNAKTLEEAFEEARLSALYEFRESKNQFYSPTVDSSKEQISDTSKELNDVPVPMEVNAINRNNNNNNNYNNYNNNNNNNNRYNNNNNFRNNNNNNNFKNFKNKNFKNNNNNNNYNNNDNNFKKNNYNNNYNNNNNNNYKNNEKEIICFNCGKGHYRNKCNIDVMVISSPLKNNASKTLNNNNEKNDEKINQINSGSTTVSVAGVFKINNILTKCLIDTGASITIINYNYCKILNLELNELKTTCKVANLSNLTIKGTVSLEILFGKVHTIKNVYVSKDLPYNCIIGYETIKSMNGIIDTVDDVLSYKFNPRIKINLLPSAQLKLNTINLITPQKVEKKDEEEDDYKIENLFTNNNNNMFAVCEEQLS